MKKILLVMLLLFITGCSNNEELPDVNEDAIEDVIDSEDVIDKEENEVEKDGLIMIEIVLEDNRTIKLELYPEKAPKTVENFLKLIDSKYFDGTVFHRVIANFMIQTGGYTVTDTEIKELPKTKAIYGEFKSNGFALNDITHEVGVISMARTSVKDSATGQFFICTGSAPHLDGDYAAFGKVVDEASLEVVMNINLAPTQNVGGHFSDFAFPIIRIKTIKRA